MLASSTEMERGAHSYAVRILGAAKMSSMATSSETGHTNILGTIATGRIRYIVFGTTMNTSVYVHC